MAVSDALIELIKCDAQAGIGIEFRIPAQRLGDTLVVVVEDGRK